YAQHNQQQSKCQHRLRHSKLTRNKLLEHGARSDAIYGYVAAMFCIQKEQISDRPAHVHHSSPATLGI
ncbi:MAG: hypothetical protein AAF649_08635, partial [Verrucomicrobiota bacterium]